MKLQRFSETLPQDRTFFIALTVGGAGNVFRLENNDGAVRLYGLVGELVADEYNSIDWLCETYSYWLYLPQLDTEAV